MIALRPYQERLVAETRSAFRSSSRVLCVAPCGAGKTVMFAAMTAGHLARSPGNRVWFLVHRRELMAQAASTFASLGIPTDRVLIGMVGTVAGHLAELTAPTMIVFDEAHHATAATWRRITAAYPDVPTVGLTATPCRLDGKPLGDVFGAMALGPTADDLIADGWLAPYDYYAPRIDLEDAKWQTRGSDYDMASVGETVDRPAIYGDVAKYADPSRRTIIYCPTLAVSRHVAEYLNGKFGRTVCAHFDGDTPTAERDALVAAFRSGEIPMLTNVDLIGEGFDVPGCDRVLLLRPTMSVALYVQQATRCLRPAPGKRAAIYDFVGNVFRHGMPTAAREWSLEKRIKPARNRTDADGPGIRECKACFRVYAGHGRICPYCAHDNGKTKREIEQERKAELERIEALEKKKERREVGLARTFGELVEIGRRRGYRNPAYWANAILRSRGKV